MISPLGFLVHTLLKNHIIPIILFFMVLTNILAIIYYSKLLSKYMEQEEKKIKNRKGISKSETIVELVIWSVLTAEVFHVIYHYIFAKGHHVSENKVSLLGISYIVIFLAEFSIDINKLRKGDYEL